jgi:hypothetical protein
MNDQCQRRALLIIFGSFVAAAAVWTLPEEGKHIPNIDPREPRGLET